MNQMIMVQLKWFIKRNNMIEFTEREIKEILIKNGYTIKIIHGTEAIPLKEYQGLCMIEEEMEWSRDRKCIFLIAYKGNKPDNICTKKEYCHYEINRVFKRLIIDKLSTEDKQ